MTDIYDEVDRRLAEGPDADQAQQLWRIISDAFDDGGAYAVANALNRVWEDKVAEFDNAHREVERIV